jgi:hypothetical protein
MIRPTSFMVRSASDCSLSCLSRRLRSVMSRAIFDAPRIFPSGPRMGETVSEMSMSVPSLRRRTVS